MTPNISTMRAAGHSPVKPGRSDKSSTDRLTIRSPPLNAVSLDRQKQAASSMEPYSISDLVARYAILPLGSLLVTAVAVAGMALRKRQAGMAISTVLVIAFTLVFDALGAGYGAFSLVVPGLVLVLGMHFWPDGRPGLTRRLAFTLVSSSFVLVATFYGLVKEECIHRMSGACDEPFFYWGTAVCCSFPIGVLVAGLLARSSHLPVKDNRWTSEAFLREACDVLVSELDWDTIDSGRLHRASCAAQTVEGLSVVVAVLDNEAVLSSVLEDVGDERRETGQTAAPLWLYVPVGIELQVPVDQNISIRRVGSGRAKDRPTRR